MYAKWPTEPTNNTKEYIDQIKLFQAQFQTLERETAKGIEVAERDYFVLLESTDLFRNYGMLLQIKNSSVVELITGSSEMIGKFK